MDKTVNQEKMETKGRKVKQVYLDSWDQRVMQASRGSQDRQGLRAPGVSQAFRGPPDLQEQASALT